MRLFKDTVSRDQYRALEVVNRFGSVFVMGILPFLIARHILVWSWCDGSFILPKIPAFNIMLTQDPSVIYGFCLVELFCGLYIPFRIIFCSVYHRQIVDALVNRCDSLGHTPVRAVLKMTAALLFIFIGGLGIMIFATPRSIRSFGLERLEIPLIMFIFAYCYMIPEICVYIIYVYQGRLTNGIVTQNRSRWSR
jgi:hypothetical protein